MATNIHASCNKRVAFAWAKYFEATRGRHQSDYNNHIRLIETADKLPEHIKSEYLDMMKELKKTWECPVCMDMIQPDNLDITNCGHFFCKPCLATYKSQNANDCKCPICRRKIGTP